MDLLSLNFIPFSMPLKLLIDGYNVIKQSPSLRQFDALDLESGREALLERLAAYRRVRGHKITVVFDGWGSSHLASRDMSQGGITVVFTKKGETADEWIMRRLGDLREGAVVTSDRGIKAYAERVGVPSISSGEFERKMDEALYADLKGIDLDEMESARYVEKGPARRLSKKERKKKSLWERL
ncbi:MAG: NYN domain-containing protein [Deltaproteobacteria bacterium]|nr:MAG: NYN domain-containing protein [Deltaproteobacteria bacterium]